MKRIISLLITLLFTSFLFAVGHQEVEAVNVVFDDLTVTETAPEWLVENTDDHIIIIDAIGREVSISKPVGSIASLLSSGNEAIRLLGSWDLVVAIDCWTVDKTMYSGLDELPVLNEGSGGNVDYEKLFELDPEVLFVPGGPGIDVQGIIEKVYPEIPVVVFDFMDIELLSVSIEKMGKILGKEAKADKFKVFNDSLLSVIGGRIQTLKDSGKPRVFLKSNGWTPDQLCTMTNKSSFGYTQTVVPGGINIAGNLTGEWIENVDQEWLLSQNPEIILVPAPAYFIPGLWGFDVDSYDVAMGERDRIMGLDIFRDSDAVKNRRVYLYDPLISTSCMSSVAILSLAKWFHPVLFADLDPQVYHQEYLDEIINIDFDLSKHGAFFYPAFE